MFDQRAHSLALLADLGRRLDRADETLTRLESEARPTLRVPPPAPLSELRAAAQARLDGAETRRPPVVSAHEDLDDVAGVPLRACACGLPLVKAALCPACTAPRRGAPSKKGTLRGRMHADAAPLRVLAQLRRLRIATYHALAACTGLPVHRTSFALYTLRARGLAAYQRGPRLWVALETT